MSSNKCIDLYDDLKNTVILMSDDINKFYEKGNKTAGKRIRKDCMIVKKALQELRKEIMDVINESKEATSK